MRLALAQINAVVGDLDGNRERIVDAIGEAKEAGADLVLFPELADHRLPAGGPPAAARLPAGRTRSARAGGGRDRRHHCPRRLPALRPRPLQRVRRARGRRDARRLPQALPAELRRLRRAPLLPGRPRARCSCGSATRWSGRPCARTSGSRARRRPTSRSRAHSCSSTSRRRRSTSARRRSARRCSSPARATTSASSPSATSSAARTSSCSTGTRSSSTTRARSSRARPRSRRRCSSSTSTRPRPIGHRLRDVRRRELERARESVPRRPCSSSGPSPPHPSRRRGRSRRSLGELEEMRRALGLGLRDYVREERLPRGRARHLRRHRLGADRRDLRRRARARAGAHRLDAVALLVRGHARGRAGRRARASASTSARFRSSTWSRRSGRARRRLRRTGPRPGRGEPPGARSAAPC